MSLAVMPMRSVPCASATPVGDSARTVARSRVTMRLMAILLGDEVTAGGVAGGHGTRRRRRGAAHVEDARAARGERAARWQHGQVRRRAGNGDERPALLAAAHRGLHEPPGVRMRGTTEQLA